MQLKPGITLQNGKYEILRVLGQGGFGITYLAEQVALHRKVAVKEFFMKEYCEREGSTSHVTLGTSGSKELVEKFRAKFIREAQMIAGLEHPHIVKIHDVFEENGTAYYVMEYLEGDSLSDRVKKDGPLPEEEALKYVRQVGDALAYLHAQNCLHFDVKPSNILVNKSGNAVLIDFGVSKHYDLAGSQTSSTPVGISKGYAPLEQYQQNEISTFTPATDIYALGATLYTLLSGEVPPSASEVNEDGLERPEGVSNRAWHAIEKAMQPRRKSRPQSVAEFLALLDSPGASEMEETEETTVIAKPNPAPKPDPSGDKPKSKSLLWAVLAGLVVVGIILGIVFGKKKHPDNPVVQIDSTEVVAPGQTENMSETQPETAPETPPEQAAPGSVKVSSTPAGATIWLDGKNTKKTTPEILEDLDPGKHTIKMVLEGYNDYSGSVTITSGTRSDLSKTLTAKENLSQKSLTTNAAATGSATLSSSKSHEWVDLGLSVKWATCNVGASTPGGYGNFYAWGEVSPKKEYKWDNYVFRTSGDSESDIVFSKYNTNGAYGPVDNKTKLDLSDDVARRQWGGSWRMPTQREWFELWNECIWTWKSMEGHPGYEITSKKNGNSIFLPAAGDHFYTTVQNRGVVGNYWSSDLEDYNRSYYAQSISFKSDGKSPCAAYRNTGCSVRPVTE